MSLADQRIRAAVAAAGGWLRFDRFLQLALHDPDHGYYGSGRVKLGTHGDFHTAPTLSPLFARVLARQLRATATSDNILELGAGDGTLAAQLLAALPECRRYLILETSGALAARQKKSLESEKRAEWLSTLPSAHTGAIIANEVLDCVPFRLLRLKNGAWRERGVTAPSSAPLLLGDRLLRGGAATHLPPPAALPDDYQTEIAPQAAALTHTLATCLKRGCLFIMDYGYGRREYYHPQRTRGTLQCFRAHHQDANPLTDIGKKDITAHIDFTLIAEAGLNAGAHLAGYTSQANALINGGITDLITAATATQSLATGILTTSAAHKLLAPHEMGDIIKWIVFTRGPTPSPPATSTNDQSHKL